MEDNQVGIRLPSLPRWVSDIGCFVFGVAHILIFGSIFYLAGLGVIERLAR